MKRKEIGNKGYSLLEVIIVATILSVLLGVVFAGVNILNGRPVEECTKKIETSLKNNRVTTMGKLSASVQYGVDAEGYIYLKETINGEPKTQRIGEKGIVVSYSTNGGVTWIPISATSTLDISFNRSTGGVKNLPTATSKLLIKVERGNKQMSVTVDKLTGRVSID